MRCGREPGGAHAAELGVCPVTTKTSANGLNGGVNGGRVCWVIENNCCQNALKEIGRNKKSSCMRCEFHISVKSEESILDLCNTVGKCLTEIYSVEAVY